MKFDKKSYKFGERVLNVMTIIFTILTIVSGALMTNEYCNEMLEDQAFTKVYETEKLYLNDYEDAIALDNVKIEKGDVIKVKFETENYEVTSTFDVNGNYVKSEYDVKCGVAAVASYTLAIIGSCIVVFVLYIPFGIIKKRMEKQEEEEEKEKARLENERFQKELEEIKNRYNSASKNDEKKTSEEPKENSVDEVLTELSGK